MKLIALFIALFSIAPSAYAQDKSHYSVFNRAPKNEMRDFDSDRPGTGDSPKTIDAGHFRFETSLMEFTHDDADEYVFNDFFLIAGLTNKTEMQIGYTTYIEQDDQQGSGDTSLRLKWNLIGDDDGDFALALLPYATFPTSQHDVGQSITTGGLEVPLNYELSDGYSFSSSPAFSVEESEETQKRIGQFQMTGGIQKEWSDQWSGFAALVSILNAEDWLAGAELGALYRASQNFQLDLSAHLGLTEADDDFVTSLGATYRL